MKNNITDLKKLDKDIPINLVLSGGGVKCVAHIALLEKIEELGLKINAISGSSGGALVACMYSSGLSFNRIMTIFKETPLFKASYFSFTKPGIFDTYYFKKVLEKNVKHNFEDLKIPLIVATSNMEKGKSHYFEEGDLIEPVMASCAIPGIFTPVKINNTLYSDGGVLDNFPIKPFKKSKLPIVGSYVSTPPKRTKKELNSALKVLVQAGFLMTYSAEKYKFKEVDFMVKFPVHNYSVLDTKEVDNIYKDSKQFLEY
ncbi:MAG: patatin-like phospholipase family protein [Tenacibaculum sp.]|nr:patatin-like phospholipase family protein [Tenacibaculum sp.]